MIPDVEASGEDVVKKDKPEIEGEELSPEVVRLEEYFQIMEKENLHELEVKEGPFQVKLVKEPRVPLFTTGVQLQRGGLKNSPAQGAKSEPEKGVHIKSPLAGVFYRARSPQSPPFVQEGDVVKPEKLLCIIEAMKVMNEINAGLSARIVKILVENGKPVEANQSLFVVEPT